MGFFSFNCLGCGHPALCSAATTRGVNEWMSGVVVLFENGTRIVGSYGGYGDIDDDDDVHDGGWWHEACWEVAGKPDYTRESRQSGDQGWFFDAGEHDLPDPRDAASR